MSSTQSSGPGGTSLTEGGQQTQTGSVAAPDPRRLSESGRDLLDLQQDLTRSLGRTYQDPQAAYANLMQDGERRISNDELRSNPGSLGPLRDGANPDDRTMGGYIAGRDSHDRSPPQAREEVSAYNEQASARQEQTQSQSASRGRDDKSLSESLNNSLTGSLSNQQSLSI